MNKNSTSEYQKDVLLVTTVNISKTHILQKGFGSVCEACLLFLRATKLDTTSAERA